MQTTSAFQANVDERFFSPSGENGFFVREQYKQSGNLMSVLAEHAMDLTHVHG